MSANNHKLAVLSLAALIGMGAMAPGADEPKKEAWKEQAVLKGHTKEGRSVAFAPDGKTLALTTWEGKAPKRTGIVKLWDVAKKKDRAVLKGHVDMVAPPAWSSDGKLLATGSTDQTVKLWDAASGKELATLKGHTTAVKVVVFDPDGKVLASGGEDGTVRLWSAEKSSDKP